MSEGLRSRVPDVPTAEKREDIREDLAGRVQKYTAELLRKRFEEPTDERRQYFHTGAHTQGVTKRAVAIAEMIGFSERKKELVTIATSFHDTVQDFDTEERSDGSIFRKRRIAENEASSAEEAIAWMEAQADGTFTEEEKGSVLRAIVTTIPEWNSQKKTVTQLTLTKEAEDIARVVALADLSSSAMDPELYGREGTQLFQEEQLDIMRALQSAKQVSDISKETQRSYLSRYQKWMDSQITFAQGRRSHLEQELEGLSDADTQKVRQLLCRFDESIEIVTDNAEVARGMDFVTFARTLVPSAFSEGA